MEKEKIFVHVYEVARVRELFFDTAKEARQFARNEFKKGNVYKVKVWKNFSVPNVVQHENLILELV